MSSAPAPKKRDTASWTTLPNELKHQVLLETLMSAWRDDLAADKHLPRGTLHATLNTASALLRVDMATSLGMAKPLVQVQALAKQERIARRNEAQALLASRTFEEVYDVDAQARWNYESEPGWQHLRLLQQTPALMRYKRCLDGLSRGLEKQRERRFGKPKVPAFTHEEAVSLGWFGCL